MKHIIKNYINGELQDHSHKKIIEITSPIDNEKIAVCPDSEPKDMKMAIEAARKAGEDWKNILPEKRASYLNKIADLLERDFTFFSNLEALDTGKPLNLCKKIDIPRSIQNLRFFASLAIGYSSKSHPMSNKHINYTLKNPLGLVGCISPWNLPLYLFTWKIAPALVMGNTVVAKPSEITPCTSAYFSSLCIEAGLPSGVLNVLHGSGSGIGHEIVKSPKIKAISFTGSTKTGKLISRESAKTLKKVSLEMGGKNPVIIFDDCNYKKMLETTIRSSFTNQGQICLSGSNIFIHHKIYNQFKKDFIQRTKELIIGDPFDLSTDIGCVVSKEHKLKILSYIKIAKEDGKILLGKENLDRKEIAKDNCLVKPTIVEDISLTSRVCIDEIFGPVVALHSFDNEDSLIKNINSSKYGLSSVIWTSNISRAHSIAEQIDCGIVWINCWMVRDLRTPFGGNKDSGFGREGGQDVINFYTQSKNICIDYNEK